MKRNFRISKMLKQPSKKTSRGKKPWEEAKKKETRGSKTKKNLHYQFSMDGFLLYHPSGDPLLLISASGTLGDPLQPTSVLTHYRGQALKKYNMHLHLVHRIRSQFLHDLPEKKRIRPSAHKIFRVIHFVVTVMCYKKKHRQLKIEWLSQTKITLTSISQSIGKWFIFKSKYFLKPARAYSVAIKNFEIFINLFACTCLYKYSQFFLII